MRRLRFADWICGLGAVALLVSLSVDGDGGWGDLGWLAIGGAAVAIAAGLATPVLTIARESPSAPLMTAVIALLAGIATAIATAIDGAPVALIAAAVLAVGAALALHDERAPGAPEIPVERRPAPQPRQ